MPGRPYKPSFKREVVRFWNERKHTKGWTKYKVADHFGIPRSTVSLWTKKTHNRKHPTTTRWIKSGEWTPAHHQPKVSTTNTKIVSELALIRMELATMSQHLREIRQTLSETKPQRWQVWK